MASYSELISLQGTEPVFHSSQAPDFSLVDNRTLVHDLSNFAAAQAFRPLLEGAAPHLQQINQQRPFRKGLDVAVEVAGEELGLINSQQHAPSIDEQLQQKTKERLAMRRK